MIRLLNRLTNKENNYIIPSSHQEVSHALVITNNFGDGVKSVAFVPPGKMKSIFSLGIIEAGTVHDFGIVDRDEVIKITSGAIRINGMIFGAGDACTIQPGQQVVFDAVMLSTYRCDFPNETR